MNFNPFTPGFYTPTNQQLIALAQRDAHELGERWQDEAADAALSGKPQRAGYIEHIAARVATGGMR